MIFKLFKSKNYYLGLNYLITSLLCIILFVSRVANYRYLLVISACFFLLFLAKIIADNIKFLEKITAILAIASFAYDVNHVEIYSSENNLNIYLTASIIIFFEIFIFKYKYILIEKLSGGDVFSLCKKCNFESISLMTYCSNCGYSPHVKSKNVDNGIYLDKRENNKITQSYNGDNTINLINLYRGENIIYKLNLGIFVPIIISINNKNILLSTMFVTNKRIIFIRKNFFDRGFVFNKSIDINSIDSICFGESIGVLKIGKCIKILTSDGNLICIDSRSMFSKVSVYDVIIDSIKIAKQNNINKSEE